MYLLLVKYFILFSHRLNNYWINDCFFDNYQLEMRFCYLFRSIKTECEIFVSVALTRYYRYRIILPSYVYTIFRIYNIISRYPFILYFIFYFFFFFYGREAVYYKCKVVCVLTRMRRKRGIVTRRSFLTFTDVVGIWKGKHNNMTRKREGAIEGESERGRERMSK